MMKAYRGPLAILAALVLFALTTTTAVVTHQLHGTSLAAVAGQAAPTTVEEVVPAPDPCERVFHEAAESIG